MRSGPRGMQPEGRQLCSHGIHPLSLPTFCSEKYFGILLSSKDMCQESVRS